MIITKLKDIDDILIYIKKDQPIILVGCAACATKCQTGGEKQVLEFKKNLEEKGYKVQSYLVLDTPCDSRIVKKDLKKLIKSNEEQLVVFACGSGVQTIESVTEGPLISALNTIYIGSTERLGQFNEFCKACGDCKLMDLDGYCSNTRCPKSTMNGPCGDVADGKCGTNIDNYCIWYLVYQKTGSIGKYKKPRKYNK